MKSLIRYCFLTILLAGGWGYFVQAQVIDDMEYFIDDGDLGVGLNPKVVISPGATITEIFTVPTATLSIGFHTIYFRTHEQISDLWSISESRSFYISASNLTAQADIIDVEYFIDNDPGFGGGTSLGIFSTTTVDFNSIIPTSTLSAGFHVLYTRTLDSDGIWGNIESRSFYISSSDLTSQANIVDVEYFIDTDPGYGAGTSLGPFASTTVNLSPVIPTNVLPVGFHTLYIRVLDSDGIWGDLESRSFYISASDLTTQANIMALEYFIDSDPGYGNATSIPVSAGTNINVNPVIPANSLPAGFHVFNIRALDSDGIWSEVESRSFYIDSFTSGKISGIEYFFNTDPGYGNAATLAILPVKDSIDSVVNVPTVPLTAGSHVLGMRIVNDNGTIGMTDYFNVTLCDGATADFISNVVCIGGSTSFTDASLNVQVGDTVKWDFDNDGLFELKYTTATTSAGDQSFTYPSEGMYTAKFVIDRAGCISMDSIQVSIEGVPISNAGVDQAICTTNMVLAAKPVAVNEAGLWEIYQGAAVITDPLDSLSSLTSITSDSVELIWTVTNSLGACNAKDTVLIMANLPISAGLLSNTVDIGQIINTDVQSVASINAGDILTTTITSQPLYGLASIMANGTIDYEPGMDALAMDSLIYRITNQCNNFAENQIDFTINNAPPVITPVSATPAAGSTEVEIDLRSIISDPNNNIDYTSLVIVSNPISGATASIDASGVLTLDYSGITFSGTDEFQLQVCDLLGVCTIETITIANVEVGGDNPPITVFNGVSPDGDGYNDFLEIENIEFYPDNVVMIINRWGAEIVRYQGYNNQDIVFKDNSLPSGTYYYHILPNVDNVNEVTGHFVLLIE